MTVLLIPEVGSAAACGLIPPHTTALSFENHQTWRDGNLHIFPSNGERFPRVSGWQAVGGEPLDMHCQRFNGPVAVLLREGAWREFTLTVGEQPALPVQVFYPAAWSLTDVALARQRLATIYPRVADLYPLGIDPSRDATFTIVATADGKKRVNVHPDDSSDVAFLSRLPADSTFDAQIARLWVRLHTSGRPHPELGPQQRRMKKVKTELPVDVFDALVEGYAALAAAHEKPQRSNHLYNALLDYFLVLVNAPNSQSPTPLCARPGIGNFIHRQADSGFVSLRDRIVYMQCLAPAHAIFLHGLASISENVSPTLIRDWIRQMHAGTYTPSRLPPGSNLDGLNWRSTFGKPDLASFVRAYEIAESMDLIDLPFHGRRPNRTTIFSEGAHLDGRWYRQSSSRRLSDRVFLLTHSYNRVAPRTTHAFDLVAANTVKALLKHGDVFVLHRAHYGETERALSESYGACDDPDFQFATDNGAIHVADTARWLKRRGYNSVIGVSRSVGALALLGAAAEGDLAALFIADPVRGHATVDTMCSPDKLFPVLQRLSENVKHMPMRLVGRRYLLFYDEGRDEKMQKAFPMMTWLDAAPERDQGDGFFQYPEDWFEEFETFIRTLDGEVREEKR